MTAGNSKNTDTWLTEQLMRDFSLTKEQAAGIAGNLSHESANFKTLQEISPVVKGSRGGYGWAQWTGPRRRDYEAYAAKNNLDPASKEANYGFLKHELTNTPERRVIDKIKNTSTPEAAAKVFSDTFLRPGIPHMSSRKALASDIFDRTAMPNMMDTGGYFNDLAPDLMAYTTPRPNPDFRPVPTPTPRPAAQQEVLAALDAANNAELARLAGNQPRPDNVYMHNPAMSDDENVRMGIMDAVMRGNPNIPKPTQKPAAPTVSRPQTPINVAQGYSGPTAALNAYFTNVPNTPSGNYGNGLSGNVSGSPVTPSQSTLFMSDRAAGLPSGGFGSTPAQGLFSQSAPAGNGSSKADPWSIPSDIQNASYTARQALGTGNGSTPMPTAKPAQQSSYSGYGQSRSAAPAPQASPGYTSSQFSGQPSASREPEYITKTVTQQVPKSPAGGMTMEQATQFAYGPTAVIDSLRSAPIPTAKPAPEYETVTKQIQVKNPNYVPTPAPQPMMAPPMPTAKPEAPQGFLGSLGSALGGLFNPAATAGGLVGGALGGPLGSVAGNLAGRGISNVVKNNPTFGNRGTTNSIGTGNGSGGPYEGQSWRNTSTGGVRVFDPASRQYVDIGGSNAGGVSESQSTGKIVCTAMNKRYGFGGFRNAIWLKYAADNLTPYHERGYHAIFQPLVDFGFGGEGKARNIVRKALEHIARERTADLWAEMRGNKRRALGRSYRAILEPVCWLVGKITKPKQVT